MSDVVERACGDPVCSGLEPCERCHGTLSALLAIALTAMPNDGSEETVSSTGVGVTEGQAKVVLGIFAAKMRETSLSVRQVITAALTARAAIPGAGETEPALLTAPFESAVKGAAEIEDDIDPAIFRPLTAVPEPGPMVLGQRPASAAEPAAEPTAEKVGQKLGGKAEGDCGCAEAEVQPAKRTRKEKTTKVKAASEKSTNGVHAKEGMT